MDKVRTKFAETELPKELWGEAIRCSAYELNRSPTSANKATPPATLWYGKNDLSKLKVFGSRAWMLTFPKQSKLNPQAKVAIMVGYSTGGYRLWESKLNTIINSRDVTFDEKNVKFNKLNEDHKCEGQERSKRLIITEEEENKSLDDQRETESEENMPNNRTEEPETTDEEERKVM